MFAIQLTNVSKVYKLYENKRDQIIDVLGLHNFGIKLKGAFKEFIALDNICLNVPQGHRVGIIGRNGAGKTTLLKLLCGNFSCTGGSVKVNGEVQALMNVGLGFHPEYTGRENVEASLQYSGLGKNDYKEAMDGIIEFCELGDFLDQPFKSYSLGMQARLMFAAATAIRPDILIVDEVLGAGDAYFVAKSKVRVERLINSGCTMLLVSHSMQQVLELCDEAIWLDGGRIRMQGDAFKVVKAYEEFVYGNTESQKPVPSALDEKIDDKSTNLKFASTGEVKMQEPYFRPNFNKVNFQELTQLEQATFHFLAPGGISRWESVRGIKVIGFAIMNERGINNRLTSLQPAKFMLTCRLEIPGPVLCRYGLLINDAKGNCVSRIWSPIDSVVGKECDLHQVDIIFNPLQFGPGEYVVGISIVAGGPLEQVNQIDRYDLLGRSFKFSVGLPDSLITTESSFYHSAEWSFNKRVV
jgi:lipopolysaccharide transport system ATP-binding protein